MAAEVALGFILLTMAFILRGLLVMIDNGTFDRFVVRLISHNNSQVKRTKRKGI